MNEDLARCLEYVVLSSEELDLIQYDLKTYEVDREKIKSNINLNPGLSYMRQPGISNNITIITNTYGINQGLVVSSNISEKLSHCR